jgi:hypothetical protein
MVGIAPAPIAIQVAASAAADTAMRSANALLPTCSVSASALFTASRRRARAGLPATPPPPGSSLRRRSNAREPVAPAESSRRR